MYFPHQYDQNRVQFDVRVFTSCFHQTISHDMTAHQKAGNMGKTVFFAREDDLRLDLSWFLMFQGTGNTKLN